MNRYRTIPGLGPQKATSSTTCQKCLKKGHYSYECKASLQERPYASRPSRSQQLQNPKLASRLTGDKPNELLNSKGVADQVLAEAEAKREAEKRRPASPGTPRGSTRSRSASSDSSVSTISTDRSLSRSPFRRRVSRDVSPPKGIHRRSSRSMSKARGRKRRRESLSSSSRSRSKTPPRIPGSHRKNRRHRTISPDDRGRHSSIRRGSHRSRSGGSPSLDVRRLGNGRRSLDTGAGDEDRAPPRYRRGERADRDGRQPFNRNEGMPTSRRERSLSPYSKRLALTQAMNTAG